MAALLLALAATGAPGAPTPIVLDGTKTSVEFDGHGGLSAGGTSRFLIECKPRFSLDSGRGGGGAECRADGGAGGGARRR